MSCLPQIKALTRKRRLDDQDTSLARQASMGRDFLPLAYGLIGCVQACSGSPIVDGFGCLRDEVIRART